MEFSLSTIADICGIAGFILSLIAVGGVININKRINSNNVNIKNTTAGGDITGRDKITKP